MRSSQGDSRSKVDPEEIQDSKGYREGDGRVINKPLD